MRKRTLLNDDAYTGPGLPAGAAAEKICDVFTADPGDEHAAAAV